MKKKILIIIVSILVTLVVVGGSIGYLTYDKLSTYLVEETLVSQMMQEILVQAGIDLSEAGRVLTEEEIESFKSVLNTKDIGKEANTSSVEVGEEKEIINNKSNQSESTATPKKEMQQAIHGAKQPITTNDLKDTLEQQAKKVASSIPSKDKNAMLNLVLSKLTSSDISYLTSLVLDGVSSSDLSEAKRIAKERFSASELEQVKGYYYQYNHLIP